uniref:Uncharacterized protein n=1 Tax=viral metagenome TaxID=1070528 RepID=A0A6M3K5X1_9ZZZZ
MKNRIEKEGEEKLTVEERLGRLERELQDHSSGYYSKHVDRSKIYSILGCQCSGNGLNCHAMFHENSFTVEELIAALLLKVKPGIKRRQEQPKEPELDVV